ncbi:hypothetical protein Cob_v000741 [Colletotrichum orbiculare MAFF 240422]|uniref:Uncharacterized protein n=1 Tax=Colletotrichum orbiculare (strain 104-T / ATCC 96160 / CBS 514.97 / LARS 414 / MAFF 240422) TaxID=1213857 RepID=A0A484G7B2_COLOR|nr:hypothetical protein Cob_v000741 [Colletotrichum orbiculare MAFF 240422]
MLVTEAAKTHRRWSFFFGATLRETRHPLSTWGYCIGCLTLVGNPVQKYHPLAHDGHTMPLSRAGQHVCH